MSEGRAVLFSGPLDGHTTAPRPQAFIWVGAAANGVRVYDRPAKGRLLYRRAHEDGTRFIYAGLTHAVCEKCENPHERTPEGLCTGCGGKLVSA